MDCTSLKEINLPEGLTSIGGFAFAGCTGLTKINLPKSLNSIGWCAFAGCTRLTKINLPKSLTLIVKDAFAGCTGLTKITVDPNNKNYSSDADGVLYNKNKTVLVQYPLGNKRKTWSVPNGVKEIGNCAFSGCTNLTEVYLPEGLTSIGYEAFSCKSLKKIYIPKSLTSIGDSAFYGCSSLTDVYYAGTQEQWKKIKIDDYNNNLTKAKIHYNYKPGSKKAPAAPKTLTASATTTSVKLTWSKVTGANGYRVYKYDTKTKKYVKVADTTKTTYTINKLKAGTAYKYQVKAYKKSGKTTLWSSAKKISVTTPKIDVPKTLKASKTTTSVKLTWGKVTGAKGYRVYKYDTKTKKYVKLADTTKTTYTINKLKAGTTYKYQVKAYKKSGKTTIWSAAKKISVTTPKIDVPKTLKASQTTTSIKLTWSKVTGAKGYRVYKYDTKTKKYVKLADTTKTTYTINKLKAGTTYKYQVKAYKKSGKTTIWSAAKSLTTATKPATPSLTVKAGAKKATLSWKKITGATGYELYMATSKNGKYSKIATISKGATVKYTKSKLTKGKTYYFKMRTVKKVDGKNIYSAYSAVKSVKVK